MNATPLRLRRAIATLVLVGLVSLTGNVALAAPFRMTYQGVFDTADSISPNGGPITNFAGPTPFTFTATFDTDSTDYVSLLPPFLQPGWVSYSPTSATLSVGSESYSVDDFASNPASGVAVAIFDQNTIFEPGFYGVGFIQDPIADGSGIVGDFASASPNFTASSLVSTTFAGYRGAGFSAGVHNPPGSGPLVEARPITLRQGSDVFQLRLGDRTEEFSDGAPLHSVSLTAVPEPGTLALAGVALAGLFVRRLRHLLV
jgi:hypothetical protein